MLSKIALNKILFFMKKIAVPLLKQTRDACGPTSLAMVLKYFNNEVPLKKIIKDVGGIKSYGVRTMALAKYAEKLGFNVHCFAYNDKTKNAIQQKPNSNLILKFLKRGLPVIVAVRTFLLRNEKFSKTGHFIVITKYQNGKFWYNDPSSAKEFSIDENDLMIAWYNNILDSSGYMLVLEPKN